MFRGFSSLPLGVRRALLLWYAGLALGFFYMLPAHRAKMLTHSVENGDTATVENLLDTYPDIRLAAYDDPSRSLSAIAIEHGDMNCLQTLLDHGATWSDGYGTASDGLREAVEKGNPEIVRLLLRHGAEVNNTDEIGRTALMSSESVVVAKMLIEAGADVNAQDSSGDSALMLTLDHPAVVETLLHSGAKPGLKNKKGETALSRAKAFARSGDSFYAYTVSVQLLQMHGAK